MLVKILQSMNQETQWFIIIIVISAIYFHIKFTPDNAHKAPAFLTTLGILGTFTGIALGLLNFNAADVQKSVPALIEGVKVAVWASAAGIFCALTIKLRDIVTVRKKSAGPRRGATIDDMMVVLRSLDQSTVGMKQVLDNLGKASGDTAGILAEIKQGRQDSNNHLMALNQSMQDFYTNVAEANSKALVSAMNQVMRDFNVKLNEQFGENFKRLNDSVEKMLEWQKTYSRQMAEVIDQQHVATKNMAVASERYQQLVTQAEAFNVIAGNMGDLIRGLETQRHQIDSSLKMLANVINTAAGGLPEIEKKIIEMTRQVGDGMKLANDEFNSNVKKIVEKTQEQVKLLDTALSDELTKSMESFGRQLAALSQKFAQDYSPITERLHAILKIVD